MPGPRPSVLFLSSDARRRYAEDILAALALPRGAVIQFRYESKYVVPSLQASIANMSVIGRRAVVAYVADVETAAPFLVPVRFASVADAECAADMVVFRLRMAEYTDLDDYPLTEDDIRTEGRRYLDRLIEVNDDRYYPATGRFPDLHIRDEPQRRPGEETRDDPQHWLGVARRLARHPTFRDSYFIRIDEPVLDRGGPVPFDEQGRLTLSDRQAAKLRVSFFTQSYSDEGEKVLSCATDGTFLKISSDDSYDVELGYDSVEFWLQPVITTFDALARVSVGFSQERPDVPEVNAGFPVLVRRSRTRMLTRVTFSAAGAFLVALPAILGTGFPMYVRVLFAIMGAALLSVSTVVIARGDR
ncbi:hypothetical protein [Spongiactinospora sp. 9N601]|uniref:hypothetical protein n=1 Tax=Spongiactinospora sp. 9N601 TaxID=3375149 RepID=UPI0037942D9D